MFGSKKPQVVTDEKRIEEILSRGIENIYPSKEFLKSKLVKGERVSLYLGIDPTGPTLHLGHAIPLKKLGALQKLGHQIILLIGDFTGMIGDPTDKSAVRKKQTRAEVLKNCASYKKQAEKFISFSGPNAALIKYNSEWLDKMKFGDVLELASLVTVEQMMKRDMFQKREQEGKPVYIHEFMYPLMQGFDSVAMDVDGEIGGNDQTFNMLMGRDLMKSLKNKDKFVITTKLLTDPSGGKMGKTEGNMVSMDQTPEDMFGKVMNWSDEMIITAFEIITDVPMEKIKEFEEELQNQGNPRDFKLKLAFEIVKLCHGEKEAEAAQDKFVNTFSKKEFPEEAPVLEAAKGEKMIEVIVNGKLVESKSEFRRLIEAGAVTDFPDQKISDPNELVGNKERKIKIGKKTFVVLKPK